MRRPRRIIGVATEGRARSLEARQRRLLAETLARARRLDGYGTTVAQLPENLDPYQALRRLPVLERATIQERPEAFRDPSERSLLLQSSGSSGTPLKFYLHPRSRWRRRRQFVAFFLRNGWRPWQRTVSLKVLPDPSARLGSSSLDRTVLRRRVSISVLEPIERQYQIIREFEPEVLHGLPTILGELASMASSDQWRPLRLRRVFTVSEVLLPSVRATIEQALGARVVDLYAAAEANIGWECERRDGFHLNMTNVVVEVLDDSGDPTPRGETGRVVITTLDNPAMPLVRYALGDMAIAGAGARCPCGRPQPLLPRVLGRRVPLLTIDGGQVSPWGVLARMHELDFLRQFQLVQPAPDALRARILVRPGRRIDEAAVRRLIAEELGEGLSVEVEAVSEFSRLPSGKAVHAVQAPMFPDRE